MKKLAIATMTGLMALGLMAQSASTTKPAEPAPVAQTQTKKAGCTKGDMSKCSKKHAAKKQGEPKQAAAAAPTTQTLPK
jgi:hypothetical protein